MDYLRYWFNFFINGFNWLFPAQCAVCGGGVPGGAGICVDCHAQIPVAEEACPRCGAPGRSGGEASARVCGACQTQPPCFDEVIAGSLYRQPVSQLIQAFKFGGKLHLAPILATLLRRQIKLEGAMPDVIAPVPLHASRMRHRGYNQSAELTRYLARYLSKDLSVTCRMRLLKRIRPTLPQTKLAGKQRRKNVKNAFSLNESVKGKHVAVVDDVMTTGSTVNEIARVLKQAGASKVSVWVVARSAKG